MLGKKITMRKLKNSQNSQLLQNYFSCAKNKILALQVNGRCLGRVSEVSACYLTMYFPFQHCNGSDFWPNPDPGPGFPNHGRYLENHLTSLTFISLLLCSILLASIDELSNDPKNNRIRAVSVPRLIIGRLTPKVWKQRRRLVKEVHQRMNTKKKACILILNIYSMIFWKKIPDEDLGSSTLLSDK